MMSTNDKHVAGCASEIGHPCNCTPPAEPTPPAQAVEDDESRRIAALLYANHDGLIKAAQELIGGFADALAQMRAERDEALEFIERRGYRRCDIPACNCNGWHQGHAEERLREISESLSDAGVNGGTIHGAEQQLATVRAALKAIAKMKTCRNVPTGPWRDLHLYCCPYCTARAALAPPPPEQP